MMGGIQEICRLETVNHIFAKSAWKGLKKLELKRFGMKPHTQNLWLMINGIQVVEEQNATGKIAQILRTIWGKSTALKVLVLEGSALKPDFRTSFWMSGILETLENLALSQPRKIQKLDCANFPHFSSHGFIRTFHKTIGDVGISGNVLPDDWVVMEQILSCYFHQFTECPDLTRLHCSFAHPDLLWAIKFHKFLADPTLRTPVYRGFKELIRLKELVIEGGGQHQFFMMHALLGLSRQPNRVPGFTLTLKLMRLKQLGTILSGNGSTLSFVTTVNVSFETVGFLMWKNIADSRQVLCDLFPNLVVFSTTFQPRDIKQDHKDLAELTVNFLNFEPFNDGRNEKTVSFHPENNVVYYDRGYEPTKKELGVLLGSIKAGITSVSKSRIDSGRISCVTFSKGKGHVYFKFM